MAYVLLIEPNTVLAQAYTQAMQFAGYRVGHCTSAQAAISEADKQVPDVVILELQLPVHNGIEFLQEFRSYPEWKHVPVIVNTVIAPSRFADGASAALKRDLGVETIVYKPRTSLQDLLRAVREYAKAA
ncbi:MAG TPA: response regulator [Candidatus Saccharimonadales bacterium]|nr:response regulator [Candidatus Saccharimonadales bacterium]